MLLKVYEILTARLLLARFILVSYVLNLSKYEKLHQ